MKVKTNVKAGARQVLTIVTLVRDVIRLIEGGKAPAKIMPAAE
jgi:hypothetical protein